MAKVNPFETAVNLFRKVAEEMELENHYPGQDLINRMTRPDMSITFRMSLAMDNVNVIIYPVQHAPLGRRVRPSYRSVGRRPMRRMWPAGLRWSGATRPSSPPGPRPSATP